MPTAHSPGHHGIVALPTGARRGNEVAFFEDRWLRYPILPRTLGLKLTVVLDPGRDDARSRVYHVGLHMSYHICRITRSLGNWVFASGRGVAGRIGSGLFVVHDVLDKLDVPEIRSTGDSNST